MTCHRCATRDRGLISFCLYCKQLSKGYNHESQLVHKFQRILTNDYLGCHGREDNITELKLRCFCLAQCGFESVLGLTLVSMSNSFSPPRGTRVSVRAEMVLVIDLAARICCTGFTLQGAKMVEMVHYNGLVTWGNNVGSSLCPLD